MKDNIMHDTQKPFFGKPVFGTPCFRFPRLLPALALGGLALAVLAPGAMAQNSASVSDAGDFTSPFDTPGGNGSGPLSGVAYDPVNQMYYGVTAFSGAHVAGEVFQFNPATGAITDVGDFNTTSSTTNLTGYAPGGNGANPQTALVYDTANGLFYGTASEGGANGDGDVFSFDPSNADPSASIVDVGDFNAPTNSSGFPAAGGNGASPTALVYDSADNAIYGTASEGGANGSGDVFSFNPSDANPSTSITDAADFSALIIAGAYNSQDNGSDPNSLVYDSASNLFYGTAGGGAHNVGDVFSFDPQTNTLTDVGDFTGNYYSSPETGGNGILPNSLTYDSASGLYYGTASTGGAHFQGDVFSFDPSAAPSASITDVADFGVVVGSGDNGQNPGSLVYDSASGVLLGVASFGGANGGADPAYEGTGDGDVFSFTPAATPTAPGTLADVGDFGVAQSRGNNGTDPGGALVYDSATSLFYGTAQLGGANGDGDVFAFNPAAVTTTGGGGTTTLTATTTSAPTVTPNPALIGEAISLAATVTPATATGTVTFTVTNAAGTVVAALSAPLHGGMATPLLDGPPPGTYAVSANYNGDAGDAPSASPTSASLTVSPGSPLAPLPVYTFQPGLQLACLDDTYTNFAAALNYTGGPSVTPPAYDTWNGANYVLTQSSAAEAAPSPGTGFWIDPASALPVYDTGSGSSVVSVSLTQGWNLIGDPFDFLPGFPLANISVNGVTGLANANAAGLLYGTLYTWGPSNATNYTAVDGTASGAVLSLFTGYWLYAFQSGETLTMTQPM